MGCYREDRAKLFVEAHSEKVRGNEHKLQQRKFSLGIKKKSFKARVSKHWNRGLEVEILKT